MDDKEKSQPILKVGQIVEGGPIEGVTEGQIEEVNQSTKEQQPPGSFYVGEFDRRKKSKISVFLKNGEDRLSKWWKGFQIKAFWIIVLIIVGMGIGVQVCEKYIYATKTDEAIKLGGFIHKDKIYDVRERMK